MCLCPVDKEVYTNACVGFQDTVCLCPVNREVYANTCVGFQDKCVSVSC